MIKEELDKIRKQRDALWEATGEAEGGLSIIMEFHTLSGKLLDEIKELKIKAEVYRTALDSHDIEVKVLNNKTKKYKVLNDPRDRTTTHIIPEEKPHDSAKPV